MREKYGRKEKSRRKAYLIVGIRVYCPGEGDGRPRSQNVRVTADRVPAKKRSAFLSIERQTGFERNTYKNYLSNLREVELTARGRILQYFVLFCLMLLGSFFPRASKAHHRHDVCKSPTLKYATAAIRTLQ